MSSVFRSKLAAQVDFETFTLAQVQRLHAAAARQDRLFGDVAARPGAQLAEQRWTAAANRTQQLTPITVGGPDGPEHDPAFPDRFFTKRMQQSFELAALQDAANAESSSWGSRFSSYTAILTMLAVALYLFGFSLTLPRVARRLFLVVGLALVATGTAWAGALANGKPKLAPEQAAVDYAQGRIAADSAVSRQDYLEAVRWFTKAIDLRPSFADAYVQRADAAFQAGSPQGSQALFTSLTSRPALEESTADLQKALSLGIDSPIARGDLGFQEFLLGLDEHDRGLLEQSVADGREAFAEAPGFVNVAYNVGLSELALGRFAAARGTYLDAIRHTIYRNVATRRLRNDEYYEEALVAGALTDLETLAAARPKLRAQVTQIKELIVGAVSRRTLTPRATDASLGDVQSDVFPGEVQIQNIRLKHYDFRKDTLSMQWYSEAPGGLGWSVLPDVSGKVYTGSDGDYGPGDMQADSNPAGTFFVLRPYLRDTYPPQCLPGGHYRVELYVDGHLLETVSHTARFAAMQPTVARNLNVRFCRLASWRHSEKSIEGFMEGYRSPDGSQGIYVFRVLAPTAYEHLPGSREAAEVLDRLVAKFQPFPQPAKLDDPAWDDYFMALHHAVERTYVYPGGAVLGGAGVADDGSVIAGIVFGSGGPKGELTDPLYSVFDSMVLTD
jgi:tetratricopeptide (TPR) repeat protein